MSRTVDNFGALAEILNWNFVKRCIYHVQIIVRKKDGVHDAVGNNDGRTIKSYMFESEADFIAKREEIVALCQLFNARAYICPSPKPVFACLENVGHLTLTKMRESYKTNNHINLHAIPDSAIAITEPLAADKKRIIDVDTLDEEKVNKVVEYINTHHIPRKREKKFDRDAKKYGLDRKSALSPIYCVLPTPNGYHILCKRFDTREFEQFAKDNDIELTYEELNVTSNNGFTVLYYCNPADAVIKFDDKPIEFKQID